MARDRQAKDGAAPLLGEAVLEALCQTGLHYSQCDEPNPADCAGCVRTRGNARYTLTVLEPLVAALVAEQRKAERERCSDVIDTCPGYKRAEQEASNAAGDVEGYSIEDLIANVRNMAESEAEERMARVADERISALLTLIAHYKIGSRPSERVLAELDRTREAWRRVGGAS